MPQLLSYHASHGSLNAQNPVRCVTDWLPNVATNSPAWAHLNMIAEQKPIDIMLYLKFLPVEWAKTVGRIKFWT